MTAEERLATKQRRARRLARRKGDKYKVDKMRDYK